MPPQELNPGNILKTSGSYWEACTLHAGVKLDIFSMIGNKRLTQKDVADKLQGDRKGVGMLLSALSAMGLLEKNDNTYSNTPLSKAFSCQRRFPVYRPHHPTPSSSGGFLEQVGSCG